MRMKRNNDRVLLESLVRKYGKNNVLNVINEMARKTKYSNDDEMYIDILNILYRNYFDGLTVNIPWDNMYGEKTVNWWVAIETEYSNIIELLEELFEFWEDDISEEISDKYDVTPAEIKEYVDSHHYDFTNDLLKMRTRIQRERRKNIHK